MESYTVKFLDYKSDKNVVYYIYSVINVKEVM
jgi:hypothetical protein